MKKSLVLMAMAGITMTGCIADKEYEYSLQKEQTKITFGTPLMYDNNVESRAIYHGEINTFTYGSAVRSYPREEEFVIFAVKYPDNITFPGWEDNDVELALFNGVTAKRDPSLDGWVPLKTGGDDPYYYWPANKKIAYAACSPADLEQAEDWNYQTNRTYGAEGLTITDFVVPSLSENHFDLLFSKRAMDKTKQDMQGTADKYSGAPIEFQHALSSIHFSLLNESESTVVLQKISLYGVNSKGTFKENITEENEDDGNIYLTYNTTSSGNVAPEWTGQSVVVSDELAYIAFDATAKDEDDNELYSGLIFPENAQYISSMMAEEGNENAGINHVLLLLPQTLPYTATLRVDYKVINGNNTTTAHKIVSLNNAPKLDAVTNKPSTDPNLIINEWKLGTKYTYRLVYSSAAAKADKIYFAPQTDSWIDAGVAVIDLAGAASVSPSDDEENNDPEGGES